MAGAVFLSGGGGAWLKIKRVDDKRMVVHTKAKANIRVKSSSGAREKRNGTVIIQKKPGISASDGKKTETGYQGIPCSITDKKKLLRDKKLVMVQRMPGKNGQAVAGKKVQGKIAALQSTKEKTDCGEETRNSTIEENDMGIRYQKIKAKKGKRNIKKSAVLKMAGASVSKETLKQIEGGEEIKDSCMVAAAVSAPAVNAAKAGKRLFQMRTVKIRKQKIKQVQPGNQAKKAETADGSKIAADDNIVIRHDIKNGGMQQADTIPAVSMAERKKTSCHIQTVKKQKEKQKQMQTGSQIKNVAKETTAIDTVSMVTMTERKKNSCHIQIVKKQKEKQKQVQTGSQIKKRETKDDRKPMQTRHSMGNEVKQQTDDGKNTQSKKQITKNPAAGETGKLIKNAAKETTVIDTVPVVTMAEKEKNSCYIQTVKRQKETKDIIKIAERSTLETGYEAGKNNRLPNDFAAQKTTDICDVHRVVSYLKTDTQKLEDGYGKKAGDRKAEFSIKRITQKQTDRKLEEINKGIAIKTYHEPEQRSVNAGIQKMENKAVIPEKEAEKQRVAKQNQPQQPAVKKISAREKIQQKNKIKKAETVVFTNDRYGKKTNSTGYRKTEKKGKQEDTKKHMVQVFTDRLRQEENQENAGKSLKDVVTMRFSILVKQIVRYVGLFFLAVAALVAMVLLPVILVVAVVYNSPFAIFFPSISSGDTTQDVLSAYLEEFNEEVDREVSNCMGYNSSQKVYITSGEEQGTDNYCDILAVYMVKYGIGDTATDMTDHAKQKLEGVLEDMCSYYVTSSAVPVVYEDGTVVVFTAKYVNVVLKSWQDMVSVYDFNEEEQELLAEIMKPENLALLGYGGNGGSSEAPGILPEQYQAVFDHVSDENGRKVLEFAISKVGCPYSQELRDNGTYFDCSSLAYYAWQNAGVTIMYQGANTAAAEGQYCYDNHLLVHYEEMQPGDLIFYSYQSNGRFMDISHVAIYAGNGMVVEAANTNLGVVYRPVQGKNSIVFIGRPR